MAVMTQDLTGACDELRESIKKRFGKEVISAVSDAMNRALDHVGKSQFTLVPSPSGFAALITLRHLNRRAPGSRF